MLTLHSASELQPNTRQALPPVETPTLRVIFPVLYGCFYSSNAVPQGLGVLGIVKNSDSLKIYFYVTEYEHL